MKNIIILFLFVTSISSCLPQKPKTTLVVDVALVHTNKEQTISIADKEAIKKRLQNSGVDITVNILTSTTARIKFKPYNLERSIKPLFEHTGHFGIYESVTSEKILPALTPLYKDSLHLNNNYMLFKGVFTPTLDERLGYIGISKIKDTAIVNTFFKSSVIQDYLKQHQLNVIFKWSVPSNVDDLLKLYALKLDRLDKPAIYGDFIKDARQQFNQMGQPSIAFEMKELPAQQWSYLTKRAAQEKFPLPVVLDNQVYVAPFVMQEIKGGSCEISGDFTVESANTIAQVIASVPIPKLEITNIEILQEKE